MLGGLVAFWGFRPRPTAPAAAPVAEAPAEPRPTETRRGRQAWSERAGWIERHPLATAEGRGLRVRLTEPQVRPRALQRNTPRDPSRSLPGPHEAPWPRGEPAETLGRLLQAEEGDGADTAAEAAFLASARKARLDPTRSDAAADPWRALLVLEAERRRALSRRRAAEDPDQTEAGGRWMERLALALVQAHPGTAVADHAWGYRLLALGDPAWDTYDRQAAGRAALSALRTSSDALVHAVAIDLLAAARPDPDLLAGLEQAWTAGTPTPWLAAAGADHAVGLGDRAAATTWIDRLADAVDLACDDGFDKATCRAWRLEVGWSRAQQGAIEGVEVEDWQEHLALAAWRCHVWRLPLPVERLEGTGRVEGRHWAWRGWRPDAGAFSGCVEAEAFFGPHPDDGTAVTLVLGG